MATSSLSVRTRNNWLVDVGLLASAVLAGLSGIYFLFVPTGGYRGGRNPWAHVQILFDRRTWDVVHTWAGVAMIVVAGFHLALHWQSVVNMASRAWNELTGCSVGLSARGRWNLFLDVVVALSFLLAAASALYFLFFLEGRAGGATVFGLGREAWDLIHTWSGVTLIASAAIHFAIHWKWVTKVARRMLVRGGLVSAEQGRAQAAQGRL